MEIISRRTRETGRRLGPPSSSRVEVGTASSTNRMTEECGPACIFDTQIIFVYFLDNNEVDLSADTKDKSGEDDVNMKAEFTELDELGLARISSANLRCIDNKYKK